MSPDAELFLDEAAKGSVISLPKRFRPVLPKWGRYPDKTSATCRLRDLGLASFSGTQWVDFIETDIIISPDRQPKNHVLDEG